MGCRAVASGGWECPVLGGALLVWAVVLVISSSFATMCSIVGDTDHTCGAVGLAMSTNSLGFMANPCIASGPLPALPVDGHHFRRLDALPILGTLRDTRNSMETLGPATSGCSVLVACRATPVIEQCSTPMVLRCCSGRGLVGSPPALAPRCTPKRAGASGGRPGRTRRRGRVDPLFQTPAALRRWTPL